MKRSQRKGRVSTVEHVDLTWKEVFYAGNRHYGHMSDAEKVIRQTGYRYVSWNDRIYHVSNGYWTDTGLTSKDVK